MIDAPKTTPAPERPLSYDPVLEEPWPDRSDELEAYLDMTPEEQAREDARLEAEMDNMAREMAELDRQMTPLQRYRDRRYRWLRIILRCRRNSREWPIAVMREIERKKLPEHQKRLVALRHEYRTGQIMGGVQ